MKKLYDFRLIFLTMFLFSCQKDQRPKTIPTDIKEKKSIVSSSTNQNELISSASSDTATIEWENQILAFYNFTEGTYGIIKNIPDEELQRLGDLLDQNDFQTASTLYNIPQSSLIELKERYFQSFSYYYYNIYQPTNSSGTNAITFEKNNSTSPSFYDDDCREIYNICNENADLDYFGRIGACYVGSITAAGFTTPIGGGIFAIGCGIWAGRHHTNDRRLCTMNYHSCN